MGIIHDYVRRVLKINLHIRKNKTRCYVYLKDHKLTRPTVMAASVFNNW